MTTRLILVTGHTFGRRAFEGILASTAYLDGAIEVPMMIGLPAEKAAGTVGYTSIADLAYDHGAEFTAAEDGTLRALASVIRGHSPHYLLVIGWSRLVHPDVLAIPGSANGASGPRRNGCIGMHPTRLPTGRGQAPIPWTIIKDFDTTALSVFFLEPDADTGPLIAQHELPVRRRETSASLFYRFGHVHFTAGEDLAPALASRAVPGRDQDHDRASRWPKRRPPDGLLLHTMMYAQIDALVRAQLGPYPRAFAAIDGRDYPVRSARPGSSSRSNPGHDATLEEVSADTIRFGCTDGVAVLTRDLR